MLNLPTQQPTITRSTTHRATLPTGLVLLLVLVGGAVAIGAQGSLTIREQGGRPFGGTVMGDPATGSIRCDHGYVEWQIPENPRAVPLLMIHASSTKTWDTTFDGREGFRNIFLRRGFPVYMTDLPRTGRAGQGCAPDRKSVV